MAAHRMSRILRLWHCAQTTFPTSRAGMKALDLAKCTVLGGGGPAILQGYSSAQRQLALLNLYQWWGAHVRSFLLRVGEKRPHHIMRNALANVSAYQGMSRRPLEACLLPRLSGLPQEAATPKCGRDCTCNLDQLEDVVLRYFRHALGQAWTLDDKASFPAVAVATRLNQLMVH